MFIYRQSPIFLPITKSLFCYQYAITLTQSSPLEKVALKITQSYGLFGTFGSLVPRSVQTIAIALYNPSLRTLALLRVTKLKWVRVLNCLLSQVTF